jgi:predicted lipid carrier protein YhbT
MTDHPTATPPAVPGPLGQLLGRLPGYPGSFAFALALNVALAPKLTPDVTALLHGKRLRLLVLDAQTAFDFTWLANRFVASRAQPEVDLCLSASAHDFYLLASHREDPDTLFFNRRLTMEGDTELGVLVKNTLDALDLPALDLARWTPGQLWQRWRQRGQAGSGPAA